MVASRRMKDRFQTASSVKAPSILPHSSPLIVDHQLQQQSQRQFDYHYHQFQLPSSSSSSSEAIMFILLTVLQLVLYFCCHRFMPVYFTPATVLYLIGAFSIIHHLKMLHINNTEYNNDGHNNNNNNNNISCSESNLCVDMAATHTPRQTRIWFICNTGYPISCAMLLFSSLHLVYVYPDVVVDLNIGVPMMLVSLNALLSAGLWIYFLETLIGSAQKLVY
jgi:hypothetical protein